MIRSFEERLNTVFQAKSGKPIRMLSREYALHEDKILEWIRKYDKYGHDGLKKTAQYQGVSRIKREIG